MIRALYIYAVALAVVGAIICLQLDALDALLPAPDVQTASVQP